MNYELISFPHGSFLLAPLRRNQPWAANIRTVSTVRSWHWFQIRVFSSCFIPRNIVSWHFSFISNSG